MGVRPQRVGDAFSEGMMGFSKMFVFCCKKNLKKKNLAPCRNWRSKGEAFLPKAEKAQPGRLLSGWLSAGYRSKCWQATSQNREPRKKECIDSRRELF